jgi:hypothetical protein
LEEPQHVGLVREPEAAHLIAILVHGPDGLGGHVHVCLRVHASRDRQPDELEARVPVLAGHRISPRRNGATLHRADP